MISSPDKKQPAYRKVGFPPRRRRYGFWIAFYIAVIIGAAATAVLFAPLL